MERGETSRTSAVHDSSDAPTGGRRPVFLVTALQDSGLQLAAPPDLSYKRGAAMSSIIVMFVHGF